MSTTAEPPTKQALTCADCGKISQPTGRLPRGWKRLDEQSFCATCWSKRYVLRAVTVPIASPIDQEWPAFRAALRTMWDLTTQASNWMVTELYARDVRRKPEVTKMPPMERVYLYPEARGLFPGLPSQSVAALEQAVQRKYRAARYETIWTCARSLPTFRYPTPFAVPNQGWTVSIEDEKVIVSFRVADARIEVRLKGGKRFYRQRRAIQSIANGKAVAGELAIYEHGRDVMCKMVAWLERPAVGKPQERTLAVRTSKDQLLVALDAEGERIWRYNADHLRRWNAEHREQLQRWSEDQKYEQRPVPAFAVRRENAAAKYRRRMRTAVQQIAAELVNYARRRKIAVLRYDDQEQSYAELPFFALRERISINCDAAGIRFDHASGELQEKEEGADE